jgi:hypothetical protein
MKRTYKYHLALYYIDACVAWCNLLILYYNAGTTDYK